MTQAVSPLSMVYPDVGVVGLSVPPVVELSGIVAIYTDVMMKGNVLY
jgi:hypothetical protein